MRRAVGLCPRHHKGPPCIIAWRQVERSWVENINSAATDAADADAPAHALVIDAEIYCNPPPNMIPLHEDRQCVQETPSPTRVCMSTRYLAL